MFASNNHPSVNHKLSNRINNLTESQTLAMARKARELAAKGVDVINLSLGEPDFDTPLPIRNAAKQAIDGGYTHYTPVSGLPEVRKAVSEKFLKENNLKYAPEEVVVSTGAKQSIANVVLSVINPGDEVIIPMPYWVSYQQIVELAEGCPVKIETSLENDYKLTAEQLEKAITPKTKLLMYSSPCNPTGSVYTNVELKALAEVLRKYENVLILSDEIYEHINYVGKHESIAQFDWLKDRVIVVNGVSKAYAMTGWRIGYIGAPKWIAEACDKMQGQFTSAASSIAQKAAEAALKMDSTPTVEMRDEFFERKKMMLQLATEITGWKLNDPQGAFYLFPDVSYYFGKSNGENRIQNADDLCMYLLNHAHVSAVTGDAFGNPSCIRLSYATSREKIVEAMKRIKAALAELK